MSATQRNPQLPAFVAPDAPLYSGGQSNILNTPVFSDLDISGGSYIDYTGTVIRYNGIVIPQVLMHAQQTKLIIKTPIQGLSGTVKQYISDGDWMVNVKGLALGGNSRYPASLVQALDAILKVGGSLQVNSKYLTQFGIFNLVITDKSFPQAMGKYSQQEFEFNALSDTPIELF